MTAILREDPPDLTRRTGRPRGLERIIRRCLEKPKEERFQSARDVAFALEALSGSWGSDSVAVSAVPTRRRFMSHALVGAAILTAFGGGVLLRRGGGPPPAFQQLTFRRGLVRNARFAPDGATIVYGARWGADAPAMFSVRAGRPESQALDLPPADIQSISSAGEMAIVLEKKRTLARLPLGRRGATGDRRGGHRGRTGRRMARNWPSRGTSRASSGSSSPGGSPSTKPTPFSARPGCLRTANAWPSWKASSFRWSTRRV